MNDEGEGRTFENLKEAIEDYIATADQNEDYMTIHEAGCPNEHSDECTCRAFRVPFADAIAIGPAAVAYMVSLALGDDEETARKEAGL